MSRRTTKATAPATQSATWALMPIDGRPIREKARKEYQKVLRDLDRVRQEIQDFEQHDKPHFSQWLHRQFGALMTQLRDVSQKLHAQRELLSEIENEALLRSCSYTRAYERVMWRREHPEAEPLGKDHAGPGPSGSHGFDEDFEALFEELRGAFAGAFGDSPDEAPPTAHQHRGNTAPTRLKELYRALARRLHPDTQEKVSPQKNEWWHQAQAAYESGDADQLQVLLTLCEIEEQGTTARTSVSLLTRVTRQLKRSLRALRSQMNQHRRDPAWHFSKTNDRSAITKGTERMMQAELLELKRALSAVESQIASWARQAQMARQRPVRRRAFPKHPEFLF